MGQSWATRERARTAPRTVSAMPSSRAAPPTQSIAAGTSPPVVASEDPLVSGSSVGGVTAVGGVGGVVGGITGGVVVAVLVSVTASVVPEPTVNCAPPSAMEFTSGPENTGTPQSTPSIAGGVSSTSVTTVPVGSWMSGAVAPAVIVTVRSTTGSP